MSGVLSLGAINKLTGEYIYPKIANKKDEYICIECNKDLILCQGKIRVSYFRHKIDSINPCHYYNNPTESQIHKDAKMLMKTILEKKIPISFIRNCCCCKQNDEYEIPETTETSIIQLEHRFKYNGPKIADVAYIDINEILCIFEICNTHKTCSENRPEPWFELSANTLLKMANDIHLNSLKIPCIRCEKCENCIEIENTSLKYYNIEKYVRVKLGQTIFPTPIRKDCENAIYYETYCENEKYCDKCKYNEWYYNVWKKEGHLKFDYDAGNYITCNKNIINLFDEDFVDKKMVIHSHKGKINAYLISNFNYNKYDYWNYDNMINNCFPCEEILNNFMGIPTIEIMIKLIKGNYNKRLVNSSINARQITMGIDVKKNVYLNVDFSKKEMIKQFGGKWNKEDKLWFIKKSIYTKNKNYIDQNIGDIINWIENNSNKNLFVSDIDECEHCNGSGSMYLSDDCYGTCWNC
jgi:hypothetical protein